jgi:FtsH-binding integral membrane protein
MSNTPLTDAQVNALRRGKDKAPADLARELGLPRNRVDAELAELEAGFPVWKGREPRWVLFVGGFLVLLLGAFAYSGNIGSGLHFDDAHTVLERDNVPTLSQYMADNVREDDPSGRKIAELRRGSLRTLESIFRWNPFRVVTYATFAFQHYLNDGLLAKPDPRDPFALRAVPGVHRFNNFVHLLNGLLAVWLAYLTFTAPAFRRSLSANRYPVTCALLVGVVFTLHPLQTQAVTYASQRAESLAATFYLLALALYVTARGRRSLPTAGSTPWATVLTWSVAGVLAGMGLVLTRVAATSFTTLLAALAAILIAAVVVSVLLVKKGLDERGHALAVGGCFVAFALGLETKEIVATLPLAIVAWELLFGRAPAEGKDATTLGGPWLVRAFRRLKGDPQRMRNLSPWLALVFLALLGVMALGGSKITQQMRGTYVRLGGRQQVEMTPQTYLLTQANVVHTYVRLAVAPVGQTLDHDYPLALMPEVEPDLAKPLVSSGFTTLLSVGLLLVTLVLVVLHGGRARAPAFGVLLGLAVLAPTSSFVVLSDVIYEHRFYLPLFGFALAAAALAERGSRYLPEAWRGRALAALVVVAALSGATLTRIRNRVWEDGIRLWTDVTDKAPLKPRGWTNLGLEYQNRETHLVEFADGESEFLNVRGLPRLKTEEERFLLLNVSKLVQVPRVVSGDQVRSIRTVGKQGFGPWTPERARELYAKAFEVEPYYAKALNNVALIATYERHNLQAEDQVLLEMIKNLSVQDDTPGDPGLIQACKEKIMRNAETERALSDEALQCFQAQLDRGWIGFHLFNNVGNLYSLRKDYPTADVYLSRAIIYNECPPEVLAVTGENRRMWGECIFRAMKQGKWQGTQAEGLEKLKTVWLSSREAFLTFLRQGARGSYADVARKSLKQVEDYLSGKARPRDRPLYTQEQW